MGRKSEHNIPEKANRILNGILVVLLLVVVRIWHVAVVQHDQKVEASQKPQRRIVLERAERATICDRFGVAMALNKVQYNAAVCYTPIRSLPRWIWREDEKGGRKKYFYRREYITKLAHFLAEELHLGAEGVEDLIHAKAAILGNVPCVLKENISEEQYFRLRMAEKDWPGVYPEIGARRCYPLGRVGAEVVGYIGPISQREYEKITHEMGLLRACISQLEEGEDPELPEGYGTVEEVALRLAELEKKAYTLNDFVGKAGVEGAFDESLRGLRGKQIYLADTRGKFLRELEGSEGPTPGNQVVLSLSSELQGYAEQLLVDYDQAPPSMRPQAVKRRALMPEHRPWIKGGAIVALDPKSGEVLALASYPRFDPNDFIRTDDPEESIAKNLLVNQWLENEQHIANIWDFKAPLEKERYHPLKNQFEEERLDLTWENFLGSILPESSPVRDLLGEKNTLREAIFVQRTTEQLLSLFESEELPLSPPKILDFVYAGEGEIPFGVTITLPERAFLEERMEEVLQQVTFLQRELAPYFRRLPLNYEKLLLADLYRIVVDAREFSPFMTELIGRISLGEYREIAGRLVSVEGGVREIVRALFHEHHFKTWRSEHFKQFLAQKREEEKAAKRRYARPYIDYLSGEEKRQFQEFWASHRWELLAFFLTGEPPTSGADLSPYLATLASWREELVAGAHGALTWSPHYHRLVEMIAPFDAPLLITYLKTMRSYHHLDRPLLGRYTGLRGKLEKHLAAAFYPTYGYGYARSHAFRQATTIGSIFKLVPAYEALCQQFHKGGALNPLTIVDDKHKVWGKRVTWNVGYFLDGKTIPRYYKGGRLPRSEHTGVGRVDLVKAMERSSNPYFALLAGDVLSDPEDMVHAAKNLGYGTPTGIDLPGEYGGRLPIDVAYNRTGLYAMAIGQHSLVGTPLQTAVMLSTIVNGGHLLKPQITCQKVPEERWRVFLPMQVQERLVEGLRQVILGEKGTARSLKHYFSYDLVSQVVGKTSTAEVIERVSLDGVSGHLKVKHIGFAATAYDGDEPELVVVVYLRHGEFGNDAAPLALRIIQKWRTLLSG